MATKSKTKYLSSIKNYCI